MAIFKNWVLCREVLPIRCPCTQRSLLLQLTTGFATKRAVIPRVEQSRRHLLVHISCAPHTMTPLSPLQASLRQSLTLRTLMSLDATAPCHSSDLPHRRGRRSPTLAQAFSRSLFIPRYSAQCFSRSASSGWPLRCYPSLHSNTQPIPPSVSALLMIWLSYSEKT